MRNQREKYNELIKNNDLEIEKLKDKISKVEIKISNLELDNKKYIIEIIL